LNPIFKNIKFVKMITSKQHIISTLQYNLNFLKAKYPLKSIGLFGSYSRDEQTEFSDIDLIVSFTRPVGMELIDLSFELEDILKKKIDLVSTKGIKPKYFDLIKKDILYA
jgi:uncharacterized protein